MTKKIFTFVDLEMNQPSGKIIQIGAVVGNIESQVVLAELDIKVNPQEILNPYIIKLTRITQEEVDVGDDLLTAYLKLVDFHKKYESFVNPVTWGGGDVTEIKQQLIANGFEDQIKGTWPFGRRWIDVKTLFVNWRIANNQPIQAGLAKAMLKLGIHFKGTKHNATDDARNTFYAYCELIRKLKD